MTCSKKIRPVTGASSTWVRENSACTTETSYRYPAAASSAVNGHGRIAIHLAARSQMTLSSKDSQIACTAAVSSTAANPLSSAVNLIPARAAIALAYSLPLQHYAAAAIMSGMVGWAVRKGWSGAVGAMTWAA